MSDPSWSSYREASFGEPYLVWHDGPDFTEFRERYAADPALATRMLAAGLAEGDALAAQTPRELELTPEQRDGFVSMLTGALPASSGVARAEIAASLFALTGSADWAAAVVEVLRSRGHWSVRLDAARLLAAFPPSPPLVDAVAAAVRDADYLVRYHAANTLLRWAGRPEEISDDAELFRLIVDDAGAAAWARAAERLAAAVER